MCIKCILLVCDYCMFTYDIFFGCRTIKLWALTGQPLLEMIGHTSLVYSVDAHSSGLIASGSEDRSVKIWKGDLLCMLWRILIKMQDTFLLHGICLYLYSVRSVKLVANMYVSRH
jgi:WD40 repeat protein